MDEQELTDAIERECGSPDRAFRLMRLYEGAKQSASGNRYTLTRQPSGEEVFRQLAIGEGYSELAVRLFLMQ